MLQSGAWSPTLCDCKVIAYIFLVKLVNRYLCTASNFCLISTKKKTSITDETVLIDWAACNDFQSHFPVVIFLIAVIYTLFHWRVQSNFSSFFSFIVDVQRTALTWILLQLLLKVHKGRPESRWSLLCSHHLWGEIFVLWNTNAVTLSYAILLNTQEVEILSHSERILQRKHCF